MASDALGDRAPTEAELDLAYKLACDANCKAAIYWQNYVSTGDHQGIFEPLSKLAIELTKALVRTPHVEGWLIERNCTKEPPLEIGGREFSTAHHAALECVCRVVDGVISETRPNPDYKFDRRCFIGWNWEKLEKRITREWRRAVEELPDGEQQPPDDGSFGVGEFQFKGQKAKGLTLEEVRFLELVVASPPTWTEAVIHLWPGSVNVIGQLKVTRDEFDQFKYRLNVKLKAEGWRDGVYSVGRTSANPGRLTLCPPKEPKPIRHVKASQQAPKRAKTRAR